MKKSFMLYCDQYEPIKSLSFEQKGMLFDSIFRFQCGENLAFTDPIVKMAFSFFKQTFMRDSTKYLEKCEKNRKNARMRWDNKNATACSRIERNAKHADSDSDSDSDNDSDNDSENDSENDKKEKKDKEKIYSPAASSILKKLNELSGKKFRESKTSLAPIQAILKNFKEADCIKVLEIKIKDKWFVDNNNYVPQTLFRESNFEKYLNETPQKSSANKPNMNTNFNEVDYGEGTAIEDIPWMQD